ncbi:MAG TPA: helix-turn-helix transcriptional regulator [Spirochaetota bacterium]|nr:helix-turn-helix transcriptional regulator [Spirochaetota bacterium]
MRDDLEKLITEKTKKEKRFSKMVDDEYDILSLAYRIHTEREKQGLSQKDLADKAKVTQQQLSSIEKGSNFTIKTLLRINKALGLRLRYAK